MASWAGAQGALSGDAASAPGPEIYEWIASALAARLLQRRLQGLFQRSGDYDISYHAIYDVHQRVAATFSPGPGVMLAISTALDGGVRRTDYETPPRTATMFRHLTRRDFVFRDPFGTSWEITLQGSTSVM